MPKAVPAKRYAVTLDPNDTGKGLKLVSLVKSPAIGTGWVALARTEAQPVKRLHLSTATGAAKQVLTGPLLIPGLDILRLDQHGDPFYINFSAEQIEAIAHRFMSEATGLSLSNQDHADALEGNTIRELWLTADPAIDKAAHYGLDVPAGTLMASMHVADADFWQREVVTGNITGFSIEGLFDFSELTLSAAPPAPRPPMSFLAKLQAALIAAFATTVALASVELKDGTALEIDEATGAVYSMNDDGSRGAAYPDGEYELKDGAKFIVTDGKHVGHKAGASDTGKATLATPPATPPAAKTPAAPVEPTLEVAPLADTAGMPELVKAVNALIDFVKQDAAEDAKEGTSGAGGAKMAATTDAGAATSALEEAIALHKKHMDGSVAPDAASQQSMMDMMEKALAALAGGAATKMGGVALEAIAMADGTELQYNPITRRLSDSTGKMVESGQYACADGSYFKVNAEQYTYQIDKESYDKGVQLAAEVTRLSATLPAGKRVKLGADAATGAVDLESLSPGKRRLALAKMAASAE